MDNQKLQKLNKFINQSYECFSFTEFLKLTILDLHEFVMYDSGMFFCGISRDCSFFKPYIGGAVEEYYQKQSFPERDRYLNDNESSDAGKEAFVYKSADYQHGIIQIDNEPRNSFLISQNEFYIVCMRIVYKGQFLGEIYLHRSKNRLDFDDEDIFTLRLMQPHVSTVFNIIHTITAVKHLEANDIPGNNMGICLFDGDMSLIGGNLTGVEMLKKVTVFGSSVLFHLKELSSDFLNDAATIGRGNAVLKTGLIKTPGGDLKVDVFIKDSQKPVDRIQYTVIMQFCDEEKATADYKFKFTKREADIIDGLIQGKNNNQLAEAFSISANTVKAHIKNIYQKTGASNRAELTYVLMLNRS